MSLSRILGLTLVEIIGDTGAKQFANNGGIVNLGIGVAGYIGIFMMLIYSVQGSSLLIVNNAWDGMSSLIESLYAFFILGERLENKSQYLGIIFIIGGLWLLRLPLFNNNTFKWPKL
jgi:multidrug transporter EmrE-like cation transporter